MQQPVRRRVLFHGAFKEKYISEIDIHADSMFSFCSILFKEVFPELLKEQFTLVIEDDAGGRVELFDVEQELSSAQGTIHIIPNPDGAIADWIIYLIIFIISLGVSLLLAPKVGRNAVDTASGSNWETADNVVGQGGAVPVLLGERMIGSRVVSHGIDSVPYMKKTAG